MASSTPDDEELALLRARAYGREADIRSDPHALQRLDELENREPEALAIETKEIPSPHDDPVIEPPQVDKEPISSSAPRKRPQLSGRARMGVWVASVLLAAVGGGLIGGLIGDRDPAVIAVLTAAPELEVPEELEQLAGSEVSDPIRFQDYLGVSVIAYSTPGSDEIPQGCIAVTDRSGVARGGCLPQGLDAIALLEVTSSSPQPLRDRHAPGAVVQFTRVGDRIEVRASR